MIARTILLFIHLLIFTSSQAQVGKNLILGIETGFVGFSDSEKLSFLINLEPKIRSTQNSFIGLRIGVAVNSQKFNSQESSSYAINPEHDHGFLSVIPTFEYYWGKDDFRPYAGVGLGAYLLANEIDLRARSRTRNLAQEVTVSPDVKPGFLIRGGFEMSRLRLGLEYNWIPKIELLGPDGELAVTLRSSYFGGTVGYVFGSR